MIDVGGGNGTQKTVFAHHFSRVISFDVSTTAIAKIRTQHKADNLRYEVFDATIPEQVQMLHQPMGDARLYVRDVLHQL